MTATNTTASTALMRLLNQVEPGYLAHHFGPGYEIDAIADTLLVVHRAEVRPEVLREAAEVAKQMPTGDCSDASDYDEAYDWGTLAVAERLCEMADEAGTDTAPSGETTQTAPATCDCMDTGPHPKLACGHCAMDLCEDCRTCAACPHTCAEGGEAQ